MYSKRGINVYTYVPLGKIFHSRYNYSNIYGWDVYWIWMLKVRPTLTAEQIYNDYIQKMKKMYVSCIAICVVCFSKLIGPQLFTTNILIYWCHACIKHDTTNVHLTRRVKWRLFIWLSIWCTASKICILGFNFCMMIACIENFLIWNKDCAIKIP